MLRDRTLFIVGAGASAEYKMPVGDELKWSIVQALHNVPEEGPSALGRMRGAIEQYAYEIGYSQSEIFADARKLANGLMQATSIDSYIENLRQHNPRIAVLGKIGIAACLLDRERSSPLFSHAGKPVAFQNLGNTWLNKLFQIMVEGQSVSTLNTLFDRATFVIFNYDRCVERFLECSLQNYFGLADSEARELVKGCTILHPYGTLGPWGKPGENPEAVGFGALGAGPTFTSQRLLKVAENDLRTYSEYIEDADEIARNQVALAATQTIVYLGFAFHRQNVGLLSRIVPRGKSRVLATTFKVPEPANEVIVDDIFSIMKVPRDDGHPTLANLEAGPFIDSYRLLLSQR